MRQRMRLISVLLGVAALGGTTAGVVAATGSDDSDRPVTGEALKKAGSVAIAHAGGGKVTESELGDEDGYYEIEVTLPNGGQMDVHLDKSFKVLSTELDDERQEQGPDNDQDQVPDKD